MSTLIDRRSCLFALPALLAAPTLAASPRQDATRAAVPDTFPAVNYELVRAVVGSSHANIDRVRELVTATPSLARAAWDWGFGDWESALGAASHMGRRDIAELLIAHGARVNLFTHAMMDHIDVVRATVGAMPDIQRILGPHGITLMRHARHGKADRVIEYLESIGGADDRPTSLDITDEEKQVYVGTYRFGPGPRDTLVAKTDGRGNLALQRADGQHRMLNRVEEHAFAPGGAPDVRIRFEVRDGRAMTVTVHDPDPIVKGVREVVGSQ